jgi:hypothetical protein
MINHFITTNQPCTNLSLISDQRPKERTLTVLYQPQTIPTQQAKTNQKLNQYFSTYLYPTRNN